MQQSKHWIHNAKVITNVYKYSIQLCTLYCCLWLENAGHICCLYWLRSHLNHCRCRTLWSFTAVRPMGLFNAPFRRLQLKLIYNCKSPKGEASARHRLCNLYFWTASSELAPDFKLRRCVFYMPWCENNDAFVITKLLHFGLKLLYEATMYQLFEEENIIGFCRISSV